MRLAALCLVLACAAGAAPASTAPKSTLKPFASEREFDALLERWRAQARTAMERRRAEAVGGLAQSAAPAVPAAKAMADSAVSEKKEADSITNVQTAGVDEGGIVKRAGDHLVILRRGRLFTVRIGGDALKPIAMVNAYAPDASPAGAWYDELLIHGSTVVVVGYSYARGGTEIGLFELGRDGALAWRATHHLRSHDYYSSRNYASRLVGSKLVFYSPMHVQPWAPSPEAFLPQWRRWNASTPDNWQRILPATRIFRTDDEIDPFTGGAALHTVTACDLAEPEAMRCEASAVLAPPGRVFYVSAANVYVWTTEWQRRPSWGVGVPPMNRSAVFRLPLDGGAPSALKTTGAPIDALSFLEDERGHLNVLLRAGARGEGMWNAERADPGRDLALLRLPLASFGDGRDSAPRQAYQPLPGANLGVLHNRFVGDWLLYGAPGATTAHALRYAERDADAQTLRLAHGVERIEALGRDAVLVGNAGRDLHFTSLRLAGDARIAGQFVQKDAAQGETRTHGFFYRASARDEGLLGLPIVGSVGTHRAGLAAHRGESAAVLFLRNRALALQPVGELQAAPQRGTDDACKASCVDWYGNARPIFLGERVIALLGYELVEGRLRHTWGGERIDELRRVNFGPQALSAWGRE